MNELDVPQAFVARLFPERNENKREEKNKRKVKKKKKGKGREEGRERAAASVSGLCVCQLRSPLTGYACVVGLKASRS